MFEAVLQFVAANLTQIPNWILILALFVIIGVERLIDRANRLPKPLKLTGSFVMVLGATSVGALLFMLNFPMKPIVESVGTVRATIGQTVPDFEFEDLNGSSVTRPSDLRGQVVVLNFWGTYCPPCVKELPHLARLEQAFPQQVTVVALTDEPADVVSNFITRLETPRIIARFTGQPWLDLETFRPLTVIIDKEGMVREYVYGERSYEQFAEMILPVL